MSAARPVGIEAVNAYCGLARTSVRDMMEGRGLDTARQANLMMEQRSVQLPFEDPVTNAVNAAKPLVDALSEEERSRIELVVTASESGLDFSKSHASYVHGQLGLSRQCRFLETKHACYAATGAVKLSAGYLASGVSPGAKALVISTDINLIGPEIPYSEPVMGNGAVAILLSDNPRVMTFELERFGLDSFDTFDTARPTTTMDFVDPDTSLLTYLECLVNSAADYCRRTADPDAMDSFDYFALHTPFPGLVKAAHRKLLRGRGKADTRAVAEDYRRRAEPSTRYASQVGNLSSAAVYLALTSIIDTESLVRPARVGLFSFGSGAASEFYSGEIHPDAAGVLAPLRIADRIAARTPVTYPEYVELQAACHDCLVPKQYRKIDLAGCEKWIEPVQEGRQTLVLAGVDNYRRSYEWR
jgi:polyketide biosynthesis 3-hydroxy-3-methylglutaryl-CoA synthase-like enzyme PksG